MGALGNVREIRSKALELGVYMPLGAALKTRDILFNRDKLVEKYHGFVDRGREGLGFVAGRTGSGIERIKVEGRKAGHHAAGTARIAGARAGRVPSAADLPIQGYADFTASEILDALSPLTQDELVVILRYEQANQNRSTIVEAIEPRLVELPISRYDRKTADEINKELGYLTKEDLRTIRDYENRTQGRKTILDRIESLA
jgi:hypothetical protein